MKTKKTGKTMRVAGLLLALVLVTSCFVGGTFAKYVTSGTGTDSARVAKFGVEITANGTMFAKNTKRMIPTLWQLLLSLWYLRMIKTWLPPEPRAIWSA